MTEKEACYEYEQVLLDKRGNYSAGLFEGKSAKEREETALFMLKTIFEKYLQWTPEQAFHYLNRDVINKLKLKPIIRYIQFPSEFDIEKDCYYIVARIYPDKFHIDKKEQTKIVYKRVLDGTASRYPKGFFEGRDGQMKALFCLKFALSEFKVFNNPEELFKFMYEHGEEFLKKYKLWEAFIMNYGEHPVDYLYDSFGKYNKEKYKDIYEKYKQLSIENPRPKDESKPERRGRKRRNPDA